MATSYTVTEVSKGAWRVEVAFESVAAGTVITLDGLPISGCVRLVSLEGTSGTATSYVPILARTSPPASATANDIVAQPVAPADAALVISVAGYGPYVVLDLDGDNLGRLYFSPQPDAGADNNGVAAFDITAPGW